MENSAMVEAVPFATYDQCVFAVAESLNAKHGALATFMAAEFAEQATVGGDAFKTDFWRDVMRAIEAGSGRDRRMN